MLQEFGVTCACGAVYTEHWKQLLKEFGAACVCGAVYTQHGKTYVAQDSAEAALSARLSYKCCAVNLLELVCRVPIYWGCVIEVFGK